MKWMLSSVALAALTLALGCTSLTAITSGQIGCPESAITITDDDPGLSARTWTAECNGRTYFCSAVSGGQYGGNQVACKEAVDAAPAPAPQATQPVVSAPAPAAPPPQAAPAPVAPPPQAPPVAPEPATAPRTNAGCHYDTQCKGDRICEGGVCVNPPTPQPSTRPAP